MNGALNRSIFCNHTPEDYQIYADKNRDRRLGHISMIVWESTDANLMRLWSLLRDEFGHGVYVINRNAVVEAEAL